MKEIISKTIVLFSFVLAATLVLENYSEFKADQSLSFSSESSNVQLKSDLLSESIKFWITFPGNDTHELKRVLEPANIHLWQNTFDRAKVFKFYIVNIAPGHPTYIGDEGVELLKKFIVFSRTHGKKIAFEVGALYAEACQTETSGGGPFDQNGLPKPSQRGISFEGGILQNFVNVDVVVDYLVIDGPMIRIYDSLYSNCVKNFGSRLTLEYTAREIAEYATAIKNYFPNIKFYLLVNFPNWNFKGTSSINTVGDRLLGPNNSPIPFENALATTVSVGQSLGVTFEGLQIDNPYNFMIYRNGHLESGSISPADQQVRWDRLKNLVNYSKELNLPSTLILNSETHEGLKPTSEQLAQASQDFAYYTTKYTEETIENMIVFPELVIQSWYAVPTSILPETLRYSFTHTFSNVFQIFEGFNTNLSPVCRYAYSNWNVCQPNNTQTRSIVSSSPIGCAGVPVTSQACVYDSQLPTQHTIYRLFNPNNGDFLSSRLASEGTPHWNYVGEAFKLFSNNPNNDLIPLYRCINILNGIHFASSFPNCDGLGVQEDLLGYLSAVVNGQIDKAIHLCRNPQAEPILITINVLECTGMNERKILGYTK